MCLETPPPEHKDVRLVSNLEFGIEQKTLVFRV